MADPRLVSYIKKQLNAGYHPEQIRYSLLQTGWRSADVDEAIEAVHRELAPSAAPVPKAQPEAPKLDTRILIVAGIAVLLVAGFLLYPVFFKPDPKELLKNLLTKAREADNIRLTYKLSLGDKGMLGGILSDTNIEYMTLGKKTKTLIGLKFLGVQTNLATYSYKDVDVSCTEILGKLSCSPSTFSKNSYSLPSEYPSETNGSSSLLDKNQMIDKAVDKFIDRIEYKGTSEAAKRQCHLFRFSVKLGELNDIYSTDSFSSSLSMLGVNKYNESEIIADFCLDSETGMPSIFNASLQSESKVKRSKETAFSMSLTLDNFARDVKPEDVEIPVSFAIENVECNRGKFDIEILGLADKSVGLKTNVYESSIFESDKNKPLFTENHGRKQLSFGKKEKLHFEHKGSKGSSYNIEVCAEDECYTQYCYSYSFSQATKTGLAGFEVPSGGWLYDDNGTLTLQIERMESITGGLIQVTNVEANVMETKKMSKDTPINLSYSERAEFKVYGLPKLEVGDEYAASIKITYDNLDTGLAGFISSGTLTGTVTYSPIEAIPIESVPWETFPVPENESGSASFGFGYEENVQQETLDIQQPQQPEEPTNVCGNAICELDFGETLQNCPQDCGMKLISGIIGLGP